MRPSSLSFFMPLVLALGAGCADEVASPSENGEPDGPSTALADLESKADGTVQSEIRVRAGQLSVWIDVVAVVDQDGPTAQRVVISGRASRDLEAVLSWVPDDAFGEARIISKRKFEVVLDEGHEINSVLSGAPLYLTLHSKTGTPRDYYVRLALEPRFTGFEGTRRIWIRDAVLPVFVRDGGHDLRYRGQVTVATAPDAPVAFWLESDDAGGPAVREVDATHYELDWTYDGLMTTLTSAAVTFAAEWETWTEHKRAELFPSVVKVAMSTEDPYLSLIGERTCDETVQRCIAGLEGADDLGACGVYRDVAICIALMR